MIQIECPNCKSSMKVAFEHAGRIEKCAQCKKRITVPDLSFHSDPEPTQLQENNEKNATTEKIIARTLMYAAGYSAILGIAYIAGILWNFPYNDVNLQRAFAIPSDSFENAIHNKVIKDSIEQYNIAARNGKLMDAHIQAGIVAAACLQAKDEKGYMAWKEIEERHARKLGIPTY